MLIKLTEVCVNGAVTTTDQYSLREVFINPEHVVMVREEGHLRQLNERSRIAPDLSAAHRFSKLILNRGHTGTEIVVIGAPEIVEKQLQIAKHKLLKG
jgi:hypothetical protein